MSAARRSLLTAAAAGTLLGALWFVPSANATSVDALAAPRSGTHTVTVSESVPLAPVSVGAVPSGATDDGARLADTGSDFDTTPYVYGGAAFLCVGAGFVAYSIRRGRAEYAER
ncbi:hypothetical protein JNUCC64_11810 [Streptomyces sp. JNUCC 64]